MAKAYGFSIKNRKTFIGRDGYGEQGDICYDGKKVGWYNNDGNGGEADIDFYQAGERRNEYENLLKGAVEKYYKARPLTGVYADLTPDAELFISELLTLMDREKSYKSLVKQGYPIVITFLSENGINEKIVGFKNIESAEKYRENKKLTDVKTYASLADFIIE